jgi:Family of unknown function (DUF6518)
MGEPVARMTSRRLWLISVVVGAGLGAFSLLADGIIGGRLFGLLGNIAAPWGLAAFFVGRLTTSTKRGAAAGALTLVGASPSTTWVERSAGTTSARRTSCGRASLWWPDR